MSFDVRERDNQVIEGSKEIQKTKLKDNPKKFSKGVYKKLVAGALATVITLTPMIANSQRVNALSSHKGDFAAITRYHSYGNSGSVGKLCEYYGVDKEGSGELAIECQNIAAQLSMGNGSGPSYNQWIMLAKGLYYLPREAASNTWNNRAQICREGAQKKGVTVTWTKFGNKVLIESIKLNK